jgi:hypothetical protein
VSVRLFAQQSDPVTNGLLQYGAVGILALVGLIAVWMLWKRIDRIYEAERQRGDRLEAALMALNEHISSELSGHLVRATEAMREVTTMLRHRDRDRGDR